MELELEEPQSFKVSIGKKSEENTESDDKTDVYSLELKEAGT